MQSKVFAIWWILVRAKPGGLASRLTGYGAPIRYFERFFPVAGGLSASNVTEAIDISSPQVDVLRRRGTPGKDSRQSARA
jgi:phosphoribosylanthranilate isomerase